MKLTRIGRFDMDGRRRGALAFLKRLRGKPARTASASAGARQMKMLRRLPQILRFIPGTAQDVRAYFLTLQYWLAGSDENVANLVRLLVDRYADGPRRALRGRGQGGRAGRLPGDRRLPSAHEGPHRRARPNACRGRPGARGTRRPAGDALLRAGRQHRPL